MISAVLLPMTSQMSPIRASPLRCKATRRKLGTFGEIPASNGTIQAIDRVLLPIDLPGNTPDPVDPPTLAGIVAASGGTFDADGTDFDILLEGESLEMYEDLEFYSWIDEADLEVSGNVG